MLVPPPPFASTQLLALARLGLALVPVSVGAMPLHAQSAPDDPFAMIYMVGSDTVGIEYVTRTATAWTGDVRLRGQPRVRWVQELGSDMRLGIEAWRPDAADSDAPTQRITLNTRGDSAYVYTSPSNGAALGAPVATLPSHAASLWLVNQSLVHAAWVAQRAARSGQDTIWAMLASGARLFPGTVATQGDTLALTLAGLESRFLMEADGTPRLVFVPAQQFRGHVVRGAAADSAARGTSVRVSYDAPPNAPYIAEHVSIPTSAGHTLAATLTRPVTSQRARHPVVITISGSGAQERDEAIPGVEGYRLFREVADTLGRRGVAVLRFDDRGVGESTGDHAAATSRDFAEDVRAIVAWLRARDDIDPDGIVLLGHSEGGLIAPMVAANDPRLAGIALLAGPAYPGARIIAFQQRAAIREQYPEAFAAVRDSIFRAAQQQVDSITRSNPWMREFMTYDPLPTAAEVRVPVLILQGEKDMQVTPEQADMLAKAIRANGNREVRVHRLSATNHLFQRDTSGVPSGYGKLAERRVTRETLGLVSDWIVEHVRR